MNHIEKYSDKELQEMQEQCKFLAESFALFSGYTKDIYKIALIEINRELDMRKLRKAGMVK